MTVMRRQQNRIELVTRIGGRHSQDTFWQKKLEDAQNVLFCKELFSQLAKEAIQLQVWSLVTTYLFFYQIYKIQGPQ